MSIPVFRLDTRRLRSSTLIRAFSAALCSRARNTEPVQWVGAGLDARGRLLEFIAIETGPDRWLVFHAMVATKKVLRELGLAR